MGQSSHKKPKPSLEEVYESVPIHSGSTRWKKLFAFFGPAYLVSVGYMDPGNWATDIAGGSQFGYKLIWVLLMSNIMALLLQGLSARLGIVKQRDLAQASRETYPKFVTLILYFLAEIAIAATDLAEVLGMAIGIQLLFDIPLIWGVAITVLDTFLLLFLINKGMRKMEAFIIFMIGVIGLSFLVEILLAKPEMSEVVTGLIPSIPDDTALYIAIGIIGATVMPHNLYLHSSLVQTRKFERTREGIKQAIKHNFIDSLIALNLAFLVNAAILILAAASFFSIGLYDVAEIQDAYKLLSPLMGNKWASVLFALALIAAGQSSTITGTLSGQIVMEGYLNLRIQPWVRRIITRSIAIIPALITILLFGEGATGELLVLSQVILSLQLGFAIIPLIHFVSNKEKMGEFVIKLPTKLASWVIASIIIALNIKLVVDEISGWLLTSENPFWIWVFVVTPTILIFGVLVYITFKPIFHFTISGKTNRYSVPHKSSLKVVLPSNYNVFESIAIAVDFSDADERSITTALCLADKSTKITFIHIVESAGAFYHGKQVRDLETSADKYFLDTYRTSLEEKGYEVETILDFGVPRKKILKIINDNDFNMLVMGTHGHRTFKDIIFGTTVKNVRHNIKIPLLIVKV
ncbi:divalent metal cation transporter MntH [Elysia marginata]|uniref:Divalent metal cation transporter MntH n=1 Tax=Elysia marginata TaxID=1093978 RepID=A0AAV4GZY9_9GAST|nr:divalent metal cation transporter MntH [Elysia marginata]